MPMNTFDILPEATQSQQDGGWRVECEFLDAVADAALSDYGESVKWEQVEAVLLAAFDALRVFFPNGLMARKDVA